MSTIENDPTILVKPLLQEFEIYDPNEEAGVRIEEKYGVNSDVNSYADVLGCLAIRGIGQYTYRDLIGTNSTNEITRMRYRIKNLSQLMPEYISSDDGIHVLQDFSVAVVIDQSKDREASIARKAAINEQKRTAKLVAHQERIDSLKQRFDQLVAEATYADEDIQSFDVDKINLFNYDSMRFTVTESQTDFVIPLIDIEDVVTARVFMELESHDNPSLHLREHNSMVQHIWDMMPQPERAVFANTYRADVPDTFISLFLTIAEQVSRHAAFRSPSAVALDENSPTTTMRHISGVSLLSEEPHDTHYTEFSVERSDASHRAHARNQLWIQDKNERYNLSIVLRKHGVMVNSQLQRIQQKSKLQYNPADQAEMKLPLVELIGSILSGDRQSLTQPEAMEIIYAANHPRYYKGIEDLGSKLEDPLSLDKTIEKLTGIAQAGLSGSYHGFAVNTPKVARASVKKLHRRR